MNDRLGIDLKVQRILKHVSQEKMAEDLNISRSKVSSWETGRREMSLYDAIIISDYFNVSMDNLFNKKALNSEEFMQIAKRYFENDKISPLDFFLKLVCSDVAINGVCLNCFNFCRTLQPVYPFVNINMFL